MKIVVYQKNRLFYVKECFFITFTLLPILDIIMEDLSTPEEEEEENENHTVNYDLITRKVFDEPLDVFTEVYSKVRIEN